MGRALDRLPTVTRWTVSGPTVYVRERNDAVAIFEGDALQVGAAALGAAPRATLIVTGRRRGRPTALPGRPSTGVRTLVYTDFAVGSPSIGTVSRPPVDWVRFAAVVRAVGGSTTFLTPYPATALPDAVRGLRIIHWTDGLSTRACARRGDRR